MSRRSTSTDIAAPVLLMFFILAMWELLVRVLGIQTFVLPTPTKIVTTIFTDSGMIFKHLQVTLFEIACGYLLAVLVGFAVSIATVYSAAFRRGALPLIVAAQTIPVIAIAPILVIWFGYNALPRIIITALVAFFPLTISFVTGLQSVTPDFIAFFRSLKASEFQIFLKLRLPAGLPSIFAGLKVATTLAVVGATISEWVGASEGIGYLIAQDTAQINTTRVFASLVVLGVFGMTFFAAVSFAERMAMPWVYGKLAWPGLRLGAKQGVAQPADARE